MKNFWFYHKYHVLITVAVIALFIWCFLPSNTGKNDAPGYCLGIVSPVYYSDGQLASLEEALAKEYGSSEVRSYHIELGSAGQDSTEISSLDMDLISKTSRAFFVADPEAFRELVSVEMSEPVPVSSIDLYKGLGFDGLYFISRSDC